ncbi:D-xylose reductase [Coemansia sp. RSA 552]|nr:D-xylose reductase [Coemansia sp. RSA 552]
MANGPTVTFPNGRTMPTVGMGLWKVSKETVAEHVYQAVKQGYRLFDNATDYANEVEVGQGLRRAMDEGLVEREELFIVGKLWNTFHAREHVKENFLRTAGDLGVDYLDMYLVHFPVALKYVPQEVRYPPEWHYEPGGEVIPVKVPFRETWEAMEALYEEGLAKNIGISNMSGAMLYDLLSYAKVRPALLQVELHPYLHRKQLVQLAQAEGLHVTAYSSMGDTGYHEINKVPGSPSFVPLLRHDVIAEIAKKHKRSSAQVLLRWAIERGLCVIPKASNTREMAENLLVFDFSLDEADMKTIAGLNENMIFNDPGEGFGRLIWAC